MSGRAGGSAWPRSRRADCASVRARDPRRAVRDRDPASAMSPNSVTASTAVSRQAGPIAVRSAAMRRGPACPTANAVSGRSAPPSVRRASAAGSMSKLARPPGARAMSTRRTRTTRRANPPRCRASRSAACGEQRPTGQGEHRGAFGCGEAGSASGRKLASTRSCGERNLASVGGKGEQRAPGRAAIPVAVPQRRLDPAHLGAIGRVPRRNGERASSCGTGSTVCEPVLPRRHGRRVSGRSRKVASSGRTRPRPALANWPSLAHVVRRYAKSGSAAGVRSRHPPVRERSVPRAHRVVSG